MLLAGILIGAALAFLVWLAFRHKPPELPEVINAEARAIETQVAAQAEALREIDADVARFNLADYLDSRTPADKD